MTCLKSYRLKITCVLLGRKLSTSAILSETCIENCYEKPIGSYLTSASNLTCCHWKSFFWWGYAYSLACWTFISKMNIKSQNLARKFVYTISINEWIQNKKQQCLQNFGEKKKPVLIFLFNRWKKDQLLIYNFKMAS